MLLWEPLPILKFSNLTLWPGHQFLFARGPNPRVLQQGCESRHTAVKGYARFWVQCVFDCVSHNVSEQAVKVRFPRWEFCETTTMVAGPEQGACWSPCLQGPPQKKIFVRKKSSENVGKIITRETNVMLQFTGGSCLILAWIIQILGLGILQGVSFPMKQEAPVLPESNVVISPVLPCDSIGSDALPRKTCGGGGGSHLTLSSQGTACPCTNWREDSVPNMKCLRLELSNRIAIGVFCVSICALNPGWMAVLRVWCGYPLLPPSPTLRSILTNNKGLPRWDKIRDWDWSHFPCPWMNLWF